MQREVASLALTPFPTLAFRPFPAPSLLPSPASPRPAEWDGVGEKHGGGKRAGGGEPGLAVKVRRCKVMESGRGRESGVEVVRGESERSG